MRRVAALLLGASVAGCLVSIDESRLATTSDAGGVDAAIASDAAPSPDAGCVAPRTTCADGCFDLVKDRGHCGSCTNACASNLVCRDSVCAPPASCSDLKTIAPSTPTGVHTIAVATKSLPVYCDMQGAGLTLVYRASAGIAGDPFVLYTGPSQNDDVAGEATPLATPNHYVSRLIARWNLELPVVEARARVLDDKGAILAELTFDAKDSSPTSFFVKERLRTSPWSDVSNATYFSASGHADAERRFFIQNAYNTCETDTGWLLVHGSATSAACPYEVPFDKVRIFYASGTNARQWASSISEGRSFAIFVR